MRTDWRSNHAESVLELTGTGGFAPGIDLLDLYLRVGSDNYRVESPDQATMLFHFQLGTVESLTFHSLPDFGDNFVSLVYQLERRSDNVQFWDSTPITVHLDSGEVLYDGFETADLTFWD